MARRNEAPPRRRTVVAAPDVLRYIDVNVSGVSEWDLLGVYPNVDRALADIEWRSAATSVATGALVRPGGNATGFTNFDYGASRKWLEVLKEIAPHLARAGVLRDATVPAGTGQWGAIQAVAPSLAVDLSPIDVHDARENERAISEFSHVPDRGLIVTTATLAMRHHDLIIALANRHTDCWESLSWKPGSMRSVQAFIGTLLCGDLFMRVGNGPAITESNIIEQSITSESLLHYTSLGPTTGSTVRNLAALKPKVLATMHGSSFFDDGATAVSALGDHYDMLLHAALADRKLVNSQPTSRKRRE
jgi:hypothetical protein